MICPTPEIAESSAHPRLRRGTHPAPLEVELGFIMDNVDSLRNLSGSGMNSRMQYYHDPIVYNFSEEDSIKKFKGEVLIFEVCCEYSFEAT